MIWSVLKRPVQFRLMNLADNALGHVRILM